MNLERIRNQLKMDEGRMLRVYKDSVGKLTVGYGRNISDRPFSEDEITLMLENDIRRTVELLDIHLPWWRNLSERRQDVLINMAYNMGVGPSQEDPTGKLLTFKNTLRAMREGDVQAVLSGLRTSLWAKQVGKRATRLIAEWEQG